MSGNKISLAEMRGFILKHYNEQEKEALRELLKMEKALITHQLVGVVLLYDLYQAFLDQIRAKAMALQEGVNQRIFASVTDEILNLLRKEAEA